MRTSNSPREILGLSNCRPLLSCPGTWLQTRHLHCTGKVRGEEGGEEREGNEERNEEIEEGRKGRREREGDDMVTVGGGELTCHVVDGPP